MEYFAHVADACRALGLQVGDTIEGKQGSLDWMSTTRLTLLWIGKSQAAWLMTERNDLSPEWSEPREVSNWSLNVRDWSLVSPPKEQ